MHNGFQISNIIEQVYSDTDKCVLYTPHVSIFDLVLHKCGLNLYAFENPNIQKQTGSFITYMPEQDMFIRSYSSFVTNQPLAHAKQSPATAFHLNSIIFAHDTNLISMKKEDMYLVCMNSFRPNDTLFFFPNQMGGFGCNRIVRSPLTYAIPDELQIKNNSRTKIGTFCYNKTLGEDLLSIIGNEIEVINVMPNNFETLNDQLNEFKLMIEFDPNSMINLLCAIASGAVGVIIDPNGLTSQYSDVPNLYTVKSIQDLQDLLKNPPVFNADALLPSKYRDFSQFQKMISYVFAMNQRKAFVL